MHGRLLSESHLTWRAVPSGPLAAATTAQAWWQRAGQWLACAFQLFLGRLAVVAYMPVRRTRVPRALFATQPDPPFRFSRRFLSSLRSPPATP